MQPVQQSLVDELIEEIHLLRRLFQHIADDVLQHRLGQIHIVLEICKGNLRLDHPEFGGMPCRVGIFRPERRSEGIDIAECLGERLALHLAGHGEIRRFSEEILREIDLSLLRLRHIHKIQRRDLEHLARSLGIRSGDQRRMHIDEAPLLKELMNGVGNQRPDAKSRLKRIRAHSEMRNRPKVLKTVPFFLHRVIRCGSSLHRNRLRLNLKRLLRLRRRNQHSRDDDRRADIEVRNLVKIAHPVVEHHLQRIEIRAVMNDHESESLGIPDTPDPAADRDFLVDVLCLIPVNLPHCDKILHHAPPLVCLIPEASL